MTLTIEGALDQYNANLNWNTPQGNPQAALEAVRFLIVNQPEQYTVGGKTIIKNLKELQEEKAKLEAVLGAAQARRNGRRRTLAYDMA